jgi:tetratricopeptide (TPR) repeat protein
MALWGRMLAARDENYERGIRCFDQGQFKDAVEAFQAVVSDGKSSGVVLRLARFYLGEAYSALALSNGASESAIENLKAAITLHPRFADLHFQLGATHIDRREWDQALSALEESLRINPKYAKAIVLRGAALYGSGKREAGLSEADRALSLDPTLPSPTLGLAKLSDSDGNFDDALAYLKQLLQIDQNAALRYARLAQSLYRREMYADALESFRQSVALAPTYADLRCQLGIETFRRSGRRV